MRSVTLWRTIGAIGALSAALLLAGCGGANNTAQNGKSLEDGGNTAVNFKGTIKLGEYGSLTGTEAAFGNSTHNSTMLAVDERNAAGGVHGYKVDVIVKDDASKNEEAATVVQLLVNQEQVVAVLGEVASGRSIPGGQVCQNAKVPMLSPSSTNPKVTQVGDYIFRACFLDDYQGYMLAKFATETLKAKTIVILQAKDQEYSTGLAQFVKLEFEQRGGRVQEILSYQSGDKNFRSQLTRVVRSKPDVLVVTGYYTEGGLIAKQAREQGITQPLLAGDGWDSGNLLDVGKEAVEGAYYVVHAPIASDDPRIKGFVTKYQDRFKKQPDSLAALAYDAAQMMLDAMDRAGDPATFEQQARTALGAGASDDAVKTEARKLYSKAIRDALATTKDFDGLSGKITMGPDRNPVKAGTLIKLTNGIPVPVATIPPR